MDITGPAATAPDDEIPPPPTVKSRVFCAADHYNAAADALQQIALHHEDEDFGIANATVLIQIAQTHGTLGLLKLAMDQSGQ